MQAPASDPRIVPAQPTDADRLARLIRTSFATVARRFDLTRENCPKHPSNCTSAWVQRDFERGVRYWLATIQDTDAPVGCAALEYAAGRDNVGYLERLAVLPQHRRCGLGDRLMQHILDVAAEEALKEIGVGIIAEQQDLRAWYRQRGFTDTGTRRFPHLPFTVAFMARRL
jgi:N-acetylglutamate synthase-like GNAT family acetyltransferase